ncbi:WD40 repeat-like protein [Mycena floridula]|nr:WD40 repeat-like protein [Mycena floridula]
MSALYPITQLLVCSSTTTIAICGSHIQILDSKSGTLKSATGTEARIIYASLDSSQKYLATVAGKALTVWEIAEDELKMLSERDLPKKPTCVEWKDLRIVVSDKFGDVFSYPLTPPPPEPAAAASEPEASQTKGKGKKKENPPAPKDSLVSHPSTSNGTLVLGHASLLTTFLLADNGKFIITADRDEHIRVSWYPQGHVIEAFCLGNKHFVSALHIPPSHPETLVSGGGDPEIRVWDWMSGKLRYEIPVAEATEFIAVKGKASERNRWGEDEDGNEENKKAGGRRKRKEKKKDKAASETPAPEEDVEMVPAEEKDEDLTILIVNKILTTTLPGAETLIIFNVLGATAMFATFLPKIDGLPSAVHSCDLGKPVLDFAIHDGFVLATLDHGRGADGSYPDAFDKPQLVAILTVTSEGKLVVAPPESLPAPSRALVDGLNRHCNVSGSASSLNLYSNIYAFPKNAHVEHDPMDRDTDAANKKQIGRMKNKSAVLEKQKTLHGSEGPQQADEMDDEPEPKKARSENEG